MIVMTSANVPGHLNHLKPSSTKARRQIKILESLYKPWALALS